MTEAAAELLRALDPSLTALATDVLLDSQRLELVARDPAGAVVVVAIGPAGEDAAVFTRALAGVAWLGARLGTWSELAPERGIDAAAPVRGLAVCPAFAPETRLAASALPGTPVRLVERPATEPLAREAPTPAVPGAGPPAAPRARFRTGLSDADLRTG